MKLNYLFTNLLLCGLLICGLFVNAQNTKVLNDDSRLLNYHEEYYEKDKVNDPSSDGNNGSQPIIRSAGGPDAFGYTFIDSDEPGGPVFSWDDITGSGTSLSLGDDAYQDIALPFIFSFYGNGYSSVKISSNGYLTFGIDGTNFSNDPIPNAITPNNIICAFWDDLNPSQGGTVHYLATASQFIVQYTDVPHFFNSGTHTFQVILNSDGSILFQYLNINYPNQSATIGIENEFGTDGLQVSWNDNGYFHLDLTVLITPPSPPSVPVSNWAIVLGVLLIGAFIVVRYRTRLA